MAGYLQSMLSELMPLWMRRKAPETDAGDAVHTRGARMAISGKDASGNAEGRAEPRIVRARRPRPTPRLAGRLPD